MHSSANEFGRLAQGIGGCIQGTNTIFFVHKHQVPADRWKDITYAKFVCELKPNIQEMHRTQFTVGSDKVHYPGDDGTPTADLTLVKMHVNSVISTRGAPYMTLDIKTFYLNMPMVGTSMSASRLMTFLRKLLLSTSCVTRCQTMDMSMSKFKRECMDYCKRAY